MTAVEITAQQRADLEIARGMASFGIPVFLGTPDATKDLGFALPGRWQQTAPDPSIVDRWRPGMALCAAMGCGLDALDFDPRNGGDVSALTGIMPIVYGVAATPSGGTHHFVASLGVGSLDGTWDGIDVKGGLADGNGRGFVFLAPTVKPSKVTGELAVYRWIQAPDLARLAAGVDDSGAAVAARVRSRRSDGGKKRVTGGSAWYQEFANSHEPHSWTAAERVIAEEMAAVSNCPKGGGFRRVLMRAAYTLGGYVGGHYLDEDVARKRLDEAISEAWGTAPDAEDLKWVQQGLDDGACRPFYVYTAEDERRWSSAAQAVAREGESPPSDAGLPPEPPWSFYSALGLEAFDPLAGTDQGLAKAVAARMLPVLRYATDAKLWAVRDSRDVWHEYADDMGEWVISLLAELMPPGDPAPASTKKEEYTAEQRAAARRALFMSSAGAGRISRKLHAILRAGHACSLRIADLDVNPEVLWAGGVPWDLRVSGDLPTAARIDPGTPHLRSAMCAPDPSCPTPRWDAFLAVLWPDAGIRAWALRVLSIALTGYPDAALPVLYGLERSGKSSMAQMLVTLLGSYGHAASPKLLSAQDNSHPEIVYDLKGRRLSFIDEGPKRGHDATERLKQITGGAVLTGRPMRANSVTFTPTHTLLMTTDSEPKVTDPAVRARMRLIPCNATESDIRPPRLALLGRGLTDEAPGILAALMRETAGYLADRDSAGNAAAPAEVRGLVQALAEGQDPVREWVDDCTVPADPGTLGRPLYNAFCRWHQDHPVFRKTVIPSVTSFGRGLSELGYPSRHTKNGEVRPLAIMGWTGGASPIPPTPAAFLGSTPSKAEAAAPVVSSRGGVELGVAPEPLTGQNTSSEPVFSTLYEELSSTAPIYKQETEKDRVKNTEETREQPSPLIPSPPTLSDVAKRASSATITKAEARAQLKAEARSASIAAAAGEVLPLPAVVDREGHIVPVSIDQAIALVRSAVQRSAALTVDVETTGYPVGHADYALRSVQLGDQVAAVVFHPVEHAGTVRDLLAEAPALHAHSASADLVPLAVAGLIDAESGWERMHDTVIPAKLADPASTGADPKLKKLAGAVLGERSVAPAANAGRDALFKAGRWLVDTKVGTPLERSGWAQVDTGCATMLRYAASDVLDTAALAQVLPWPPAAIYERERLAQRMTARVTLHGIRLDAAHIGELTEQHTAGRAAAAARVRVFDVDNPGSDQQVGVAAVRLGATLPTTPSGRPSVAAGILEPLRGSQGDLGDFVGAVLDYRHADTALGLFLEPYRMLCDRGDGRARPTIYTLGADTGRATCVQSDALIEMPRDLSKYPNGVPITEVKEGDWVYAFDHHRELVLRRVKWCAQTAVRQTVIITAENRDGRKLTLRTTPEHLIRLYNGDWRAAQGLIHNPGRPHREDGPRLMTMVRRYIDGGYAKFFPHANAMGNGPNGGGKNREARWVASAVRGKAVSTKWDVDHIDGNKVNNHPDNLRPLPSKDHRGNRSLAWGTKQPVLDFYVGPNDYRVVSVEHGIVEPVWDMEVEDAHNFIANGICVHNCVRPNLQQVSREGGMRACLTADPGELMIGADFSSVEVRVAAALSQDHALMQMLIDGRDLHAEIARLVWGPDATKAHRYKAKPMVFQRIYGGGVPGMARQHGVSIEVAQRVVDALDRLTPTLSAWSAALSAGVQRGQVTFPSYSGRVIHLPRDRGFAAANYAIQGSARELLVDALVKWRETRWGKSRLLPVHDELDVFVPEAEAAEATAELVRCMQSELYGVRIQAAPSVPSFAWADAA